MSDLITNSDGWDFLRKYTKARIAIGRAGNSIPTAELLKFQLAHAKARDAVYSEINVEHLKHQLKLLKLTTIEVKSCAASREIYLKNPNLGRSLDEDSVSKLKTDTSYDLCIVIADGLSSEAVNRHAIPLIDLLITKLQNQWTLAPVVIAEQARVALGDEIGEMIKAEILIILIGERPGLSSPDSMGAYITYKPARGLTDERRNCISNIRPEGLLYEAAADKIFYLINEMKVKKISGVDLKDEQDPNLKITNL